MDVQRKLEILADANLARGVPQKKTLPFVVPSDYSRHCERSEAESISPRDMDCLRFAAMTRRTCTTSPSTAKPISTAGAKPPARWR